MENGKLVRLYALYKTKNAHYFAFKTSIDTQICLKLCTIHFYPILSVRVTHILAFYNLAHPYSTHIFAQCFVVSYSHDVKMQCNIYTQHRSRFFLCRRKIHKQKNKENAKHTMGMEKKNIRLRIQTFFFSLSVLCQTCVER